MVKEMANKKVTIGEIERLVENAIEENGVTVVSVEPNSDGEYCSVILEGDISIRTFKAIEKAVGDDPIISGEDYDQIRLFFRIPNADEIGNGDDEEDDEPEPEMKATPAIPDDMRHREEFYDSEDVIIPGTEVKRSNTEQNEQIMTWMKETGHYPIVYLRLDDGVHVEVSDIYDQKVRDVLERGEAVGGDGRKYKIENPDNIFPIGDSICVRATCIETGRGDVYGLDFLV